MTTHLINRRARSALARRLVLTLALMPLIALFTIACAGAENGRPTDASTSGVSASSLSGATLPWPDLPQDSGASAPGSTSAPTPATDMPNADSLTAMTSTESSGDPMITFSLRLSEIHPDPEGKDGGPGTPEFLEFVNVGDAPVPLAQVTVNARSWPTLTGETLGWHAIDLLPGESVLVERFADAADVPTPPLRATEYGYAVAFRSGDGLRNADGAARLGRGAAETLDVVQYGLAQAEPYVGPGAWSGPPAPVPGAGESLCRVSMDVDLDQASDWTLCPPSPGVVATESGESDSGWDTTGADTTGGETWATWGTWDTWDTWDTWATSDGTTTP